MKIEWTSEPPAKPGLYWVKIDKASTTVHVWYFVTGETLFWTMLGVDELFTVHQDWGNYIDMRSIEPLEVPE